MRTKRMRVFPLLLIIVLAACGPLPQSVTINVGGPTQDVGQIVQATFDAMTAQAGGPVPLATPTGASAAESAATPTEAASTAGSGSISGNLSYPSETIPSLNVVAFQAGTENYQYVITNQGQSTYEINNLNPGTYHVVAYTGGGGGLAGGYSQAVPCGLSANCTDHTLIDVTVAAGGTVTDVNPSDWYAPQGAFPSFPGSASSSDSTSQPVGADGSIAGKLMYPSSHIPPLRVVAFQLGTSNFKYVDTVENQTAYQIDSLAPGTYHVVAYTLGSSGSAGDPAGGYSQMVPCGLSVSCTDHSLIDVTVTSNHVTTGVDPNDYYANPGAFPPYPGP